MTIRTYWKSLLLIGMATTVMVVAVNMSQAENRWVETIEGTKAENAMVGAASGGLLGGVAAALIGGIGVVAMGTGIGAPAGVGLIAFAAGIGAGGGALVGAATGNSDIQVEMGAPAYEPWQWLLLMAVSVAMYVWAIVEFRTAARQSDTSRISGS
jgi:hypothetical protein